MNFLPLVPFALVLIYYTVNNLDMKTGEKQKLCAFCRTYIPQSATTCKNCTKEQPKEQPRRTEAWPIGTISNTPSAPKKYCKTCNTRVPLDATVCLVCNDEP
jgi:ribosomal protein L40E